MSATIYLADLRYNYSGFVANDCMPLGVAYMKAVMDRDLPEVRSRLFAYPDRLWETMRSDPPDVLMVSNYIWNEELSFHLARLGKQLHPDMFVVMGGPNIPLEPERQTAYMAARPEIDLYVLGEGDFLATEVVRHYLEAGKSTKKLGEREVPSSIYRRPDGQLVRQGMKARHNEVDEVPSPWLTGIQDEFFDGKLAPMIETNRGCPFTCTFCVQGTSWYTKVHNFSKDRMREELDYIARRVKQVCPEMGTLRIADSNYGMFERDIEISGYIGEMQKQYGWPTFIDATTGKNRPERIVQSVEKASGALVLYQAVQSLDENVLRNIKRQNIKLAAYEQIHVYMRGRGLRSNSDLILCLPGETLRTHVDAIHKLVDNGIQQMHNLQLVLLNGSELETEASRQQFKFTTRFRVLPKNFGVYGGAKVLDIEEIVVASDTMPFEDYLMSRKYHLACSVFWNDSWFEDAVRFAESGGIKRSEWLEAVVQAMDRDRGAVGKFVDAFVAETKGELFPTREACREFYSADENFQRLANGDIGDNLMYKYRAIASFHLWPEICRLAMDVTRRLLVERGVAEQIADFGDFWADFHRYEELKHASGATEAEILSPVRTRLRYDIVRWLEDGLPKDSSAYRLTPPQEFEFGLSPTGGQNLRDALRVWTTNLKGLTKMVTRIQIVWQVRECRCVAELVETSQS
jgi:radical SAM superfamily enzyme YgiQ (UPF0313 family)